MKTQTILAAAIVLLLVNSTWASQHEWSVSVQVDLGEDLGQNYGTLFEVVDSEGVVVAGAGYVGSYNTQSRSDRRGLHFFVKPKEDPTFEPVAMPRPTTDAGTYLFDFDGQLYCKGRGGADGRLRRWDGNASTWTEDVNVPVFGVSVGNGVLSSNSRGVYLNGNAVLNLKPKAGSLAERYYANGHIVFRRYDRTSSPPVNELIACPWKNSQPKATAWQAGKAIALGTPNEFVYAYGQLADQILAATNTGGLYVFDGVTWNTILEPDVNVSFQIYSMINYRDRLLMGQYPTGELFAYDVADDGQKLEHLPEWPPAMPGVRKQAREAQTLAIYGGDLYAGIWPWGEVWKYAGPSTGWEFRGRLFTHPTPTDKTTHPYEDQAKQLGQVMNRWGQRVTSLVPQGARLVVSTSSKGGKAYEPKFGFLEEDQWKEYGAVYEYARPGALVAATEWTTGPTKFEFQIRQGRLRIVQDGTLIGTAAAPEELAGEISGAKVTWGEGIFGPFRGNIIARQSDLAAGVAVNKPFLGAYIDMHHCFEKSDDQRTCRSKIDRQLDRFRECGLNTIMPKCTTSAGRANYPSELISNRTYPDWDPLEHFVSGARQRSLKVWPSVCVLVCGHDQPSGILVEHPQWAMRNPEGKPIGYISPGHPEARKWIVSLLEEVVRKYEPDGLLLDYLRYHNRPIQLDEYSLSMFEQELAKAGKVSEEERKVRLQLFRERLLTELMEQIHNTLHRLRPQLKLSIYSWGPHVLENHRVAQDWQTWVERGYLDMINVSGYLYPERNGADYLAKLEDKLRTAKSIVAKTGRPIPVTFALGVRTSHGEVTSAEQIGELLTAAKRADLEGVAFFTWSYLQPWLDDVIEAGSLALFDSTE